MATVDANFEDIKLIISILALLIGSFSLIWQFYRWRQESVGYMQLKISSSAQMRDNKSYLSCKTELENTGRRPIKIYYAFLLVYNEDQTNLDTVITTITDKCKKDGKIISNDMTSHEVLEYLKINYEDGFGDNNFDLIPLRYYYDLNSRLGNYDALSYTSLTERRKGRYSVFFFVTAEKWRKKEPTSARSVHDQVLIT